MKKNNKELFVLILFSGILIGILANYNIIIECIRYTTNLWLTKLFGSLFPFLVIGSILIQLNFAEVTKKLFHIKSNSLIIMLLSALSGFPSNAKYIKDMYLKKEIDLDFANNALCYSFFSNPLFLISTLSILFSKKLTIVIIFIHYISNFFIYLILPKVKNNNLISYHSKPLGDIIAIAIKDSINTMLLILGTISFYSIIIVLLKEYLNNPLLLGIINGLLEFSSGLYNLSTLNISIFLSAYLATIFICFGSLSIHTQIKSIISDTPIKYKKFFIFRIVHTFIACLLLTLFFIITNF